MKRAARVGVAAALAAALLGLCACTSSAEPTEPNIPPGITAPPPTPRATATPSPSAAPIESQLPAEIAGIDTSGWQQIPGPDNAVTFRIPPDWTVGEVDAGLAVLRPDGEQQLVLQQAPSENSGRCLDPAGEAVAWRTVPLDRQSMEVEGTQDAAFGASALLLDNRWIVSVGVLPNAQATTPRCPIINAIETPSGSWSFGSEAVVQGAGAGEAWVVTSLDAAQAYTDTEEFATIRTILMSFEAAPAAG